MSRQGDTSKLRELEKEIRRLRKKLHRSEIHRAELEHLRDKDQALYRTMNTELQSTLNELQAAQNQLIQSEKLASLGQLTAGIAHEIKNPLNFVNNFAALTYELVEDLREMLATGASQEDLEDLLEDLALNTGKIEEHGRRADNIVRSMLEHSRDVPSERRPIALNALVEEYLSLAYHGMRASTPDFQVALERDYDETVEAITVVPQDISRVVLNMLNNAFYAVYERHQEAPADYKPTVWVSTRKIGDTVEIRVRDNGTGIPEEIRKKIFEPFFTTKPTGSGTGLGLSLAYDIVTKGHSGRLNVVSVEGEGTTFIITLPHKT